MYKPKYDLFCPMCNHSIGVRGEKTEIFRQYVAYCRHCKCEFTVNYFVATDYDGIKARAVVRTSEPSDVDADYTD